MLLVLGNCTQLGLKRKLSDHSPVLLKPDNCPVLLKPDNCDWGPKPFKVLNCWMEHPEFKKVASDHWIATTVNGWAGFRCKEKLKSLKSHLKEWNRSNFGNFNEQINQEAEKMYDLANEDEDLAENEALLRSGCFSKIWKLLKTRESCWQQKARSIWFKKGDANTRYFHRYASRRRSRNSIQGLSINGIWEENPEKVKEEVVRHFRNRFASLDNIQVSFPIMPQKTLSNFDCEWLEREFSLDEIKQAVWDCGGDKSPGPDGFNFRFIKAIWSTITDDIKQFVDDFYSHGKLVKGLNSSFITLIPKKQSPQTLDDFRPISLINCLYKIIAKCLANRLRSVMDTIISSTQTTFIGGRNIFDSIMACNEMLHSMKQNRSGSFAFKVDFEKAFDCVQWDFLFQMMDRMGFGQRWIQWISQCLKTASVSVLINGSPTKEFHMSRGLRQGDSLSPFLFLIVAEGLHLLVEEAKRKNLLSGILVGNSGLSVSHLQYADDTILLAPASLSNVLAFKSILRWFELFSGLKVNFRKSILVGFRVTDNWCFTAANILKCTIGSLPFKYLGVPVGGCPGNSNFWKPIIDKHFNKLAIWKCKSLSIGGRITLLKLVMSALPIYVLSIFKALSKDNIEKKQDRKSVV